MSKPSTTTTDSGASTILVALEKLRVREGFNHRVEAERDAEKYELTVSTLRQVGQLQPLLVGPADADGIHDIIAGAKRFRAAKDAGLTAMEVKVRDEAGIGDELVLSLIENITHDGISPLEEARGFARMRDQGMTEAQIARKLRPISKMRVHRRLQLLDLPQDLQSDFAEGSVPQHAVPALLEISRADPALAVAAARLVASQSSNPSPYGTPWEWADLAAGEHRCALLDELVGHPLPEHLVNTTVGVALAAVKLDADGEKAWQEICELRGHEPDDRDHVVIGLTREDLDYAQRVGARLENWIIGHDTVAAIVGEHLRSRARAERARQDAQAKRAAAAQAAAEATPPAIAAANAATGAPSPATGPASEDEQARALASALAVLKLDLADKPVGELDDLIEAFRDQHGQHALPRRVENIALRRQQAAARSFNDLLGHAVRTRFAKVRVDERALKILTAFDVHGNLEGIASRGARYCWPEYHTVTPASRGPAKVTYCEMRHARELARTYLEGATTVSEIAGRQLALIVMAHFADQRATARSNRVWSEYGFLGSEYRNRYDHYVPLAGVPWAGEVNQLVAQLAAEKLPVDLVAADLAYYERYAVREAEKAEATAARHAAECDFAASLGSFTDATALHDAEEAFFEAHEVLDPRIQDQVTHFVLAIEADALAASETASGETPADPEPSEEHDEQPPVVQEDAVLAVA
jgi:ParB/RepB/Spo0J family partition protein